MAQEHNCRSWRRSRNPYLCGKANETVPVIRGQPASQPPLPFFGAGFSGRELHQRRAGSDVYDLGAGTWVERQASMDGRAVSGAAGEKEGFGLMILMIGAMQSGKGNMRDYSFVQHRGAHWSRPRISVRDAIHPIQNPKHDVMGEKKVFVEKAARMIFDDFDIFDRLKRK
ncbi:hypothetical protein BC826DRAFT_1120510 [Russula brevipes]|nr:hypothetical protein BC826DRAFT_1120510 [Russula brevipes]